MTDMKFTVVIEQGVDYLVGEVIELPGCRSQAKTRVQLIERMREAIAAYLSVKQPSKVVVGVEQIEVA